MRRLALFLLVLVFMQSIAHAQERAPDGQLGVGLHTRGLSVQYAFGPMIHAGLHAMVHYTTSEGAEAATVGAMPYVRVIHEGFVSPFVEAGVDLGFTSSKAGYTTTTQVTSAIVALVGLEWFVERTLGIYVAAELLNAQLSPVPTYTSFGVFYPRAGIEWYFGG
jgi:hypothetical protein